MTEQIAPWISLPRDACPLETSFQIFVLRLLGGYTFPGGNDVASFTANSESGAIEEARRALGLVTLDAVMAPDQERFQLFALFRRILPSPGTALD